MKEIRTEIIIDAPKEQVWQVLTDFPAYGEWNSFITSIEGELKEGARLTNTLVSNGKPRVFKPIIQKVVENREFEWQGSIPLNLFTGRHYFILDEVGPGQTKLIHGEKFGGLLRAWIMKKIGEETLHNFQNWNKAIKKRVEVMVNSM